MIGEARIEDYLSTLAHHWDVSEAQLASFLSDLRSDQKFLEAINCLIKDVADFNGKQFKDVAEMRVYRTLLYLVTRARQPEIFVETGVQNGMSSAFILLGLDHNAAGRLFSVDRPPVDQRILDQGTRPLPSGKAPGWIIPDYLHSRHDLRLGKAEVILPALLAELGRTDVFLHDSDHSYSHIMFESALAWSYLTPGGLLLIDNTEQNEAFTDFSRGVEATSFVISTFDTPQRRWQHGIALKDRRVMHG
jgi:predicted O-methyltransferase YrrM